MFHVNTRSLSKNVDQLLNVLSAAEAKFDVIGITETKQQMENVDLDGYCVFTSTSKSNAGDVALYVNNRLDHLERNDLGTLDDDFESIWTEIKNKKGNNFLCDSLYRHPNTDTATFMEYIESTPTKIDKNKYAHGLI